MKTLRMVTLFLLVVFVSTKSFSWDGMPTPPLHVEGRFLKDPSGKNVLLHGWMQPIETWFNGGGNRYSNPTDWTNPSNVAGMLNFLRDAATVMSDPAPKYGRSHGWYASFVRVNCDFVGGWTQENGLVNAAQFNGWIQNFVVPYANHLRSRGLYLVLCATGPMMTPNNGAQNAGIVEQQRLRTFWSTVANAPGIKNADNIMFELMNEPVQIESSPGNGNWGSGSAPYFQAFRNWIQPIINDIRNTGSNNVIWVPCLGWQGEAHGWAQYPFTGSNIGVAAHYYPAYGGVYDNPTAVQNLWNSNYKPAADLWPMMITECYWFPGGTGYDDLFNGTTAGFGNALKNAMDNQGNVSFLIGFLADHLVDLANSTPANCTLGSRQATQAYFAWLPTYTWAAPTDGSCTPTAVTPYIQVNNGSWQQTSTVTVSSGALVRFGPQPVSGGSWSWSGCGTSGSSREQTISPTGSCTATVTYTNTCGAQSTQTFNVTVSGGDTYNGIYSFVAQHSGKALDVSGGGTSNGTNVQQWFYYASNDNERFQVTHLGGGWHRISPVIATGQALDVSGISTADGANIHTWQYLGGNNQQWRFESSGNGYWKIIARHSGKCLDVSGISTADGANVHQWTCISGAQNQAFQIIPNGSGSARMAFYGTELSDPLDDRQFLVYPNPSTSGNFSVKVSSDSGEHYRLSIFSAEGKKIYETGKLSPGTHEITADLAKGLYFIKADGAKHLGFKKLLVR